MNQYNCYCFREIVCLRSILFESYERFISTGVWISSKYKTHTMVIYSKDYTKRPKLHSVDLSKIILIKFIKVLITKVHVIGFY